MNRAWRLLALTPAILLAQWDDRLLKAFTVNHRAAAVSPADVSFLLEAPAGRDGFIRVKDGHFVRPDGRRLRFWGVHFTDWSKGSVMLPPREDSPLWAATLARHGVNCVRLHFLDLFAPRGILDNTRSDSRAFDARQLDRLDFLVSELKKRGIYVDLNLNVGRSYKTGDGVQDAEKIRWGKGLVLYDPRLIELQKEYAKQILTHLNPYTKNEYRNEPAVAIVEILNENGLYLGFRAPTPYYDDLLTTQYKDQVLVSRRLPPTAAPYFTPGFPLAFPLMHRVRISSFEGRPTEKYAAPSADPVVSDTKELAWHVSAEKEGFVTVDTARTQALIGFVKANRKPLRNFSAELNTHFASLVLSSLDGRPISRSGKLLLSAGSRVANSGSKWNETRTRLAAYGGPPTLIEPVSGTVQFRDLHKATAVSAAALDGAGHPLGSSIQARKTAEGWTLPLGKPVTPWYVITVERR